MKTSRLYKCLVTLIMVVFCVFGAYGVPSTRYEGTSTNNHLHLGLEWQSMKGLYGYYNNARFRDAILAGTFFQQDPLAEKYYPYTPYHYGVGNPLKYVYVSGGEPTPAEALRMSSHVYGDQSDDVLIGGWSISKNKTDLLNKSYGLKSAVYERTLENGNTEYTYAFAGTQDATDILHDGLQLIGASGQYTQAIENLQALQENIGSAELTLTGHSLGGGLAALGSMKTGLKALTFNAAGVSSATKLFNGVNMIKPAENNIDAYILASDPLNLIQNIPFNPLPVIFWRWSKYWALSYVGILTVWCISMTAMTIWGNVLADWCHIVMVVAWIIVLLHQLDFKRCA